MICSNLCMCHLTSWWKELKKGPYFYPSAFSPSRSHLWGMTTILPRYLTIHLSDTSSISQHQKAHFQIQKNSNLKHFHVAHTKKSQIFKALYVKINKAFLKKNNSENSSHIPKFLSHFSLKIFHYPLKLFSTINSPPTCSSFYCSYNCIQLYVNHNPVHSSKDVFWWGQKYLRKNMVSFWIHSIKRFIWRLEQVNYKIGKKVCPI